jgi:hypothetical protein
VSFAWGLRDGANWSIISILILQGAGSETAAGYLSVGFALLGIAANYAAGRTCVPARYSAFWGWGSLLALAAALAISFFPTMGGAIALGVIGKISDTLILIPFNAAFLGVLGGYQRDEGTGAGRNVASEVWINAGRTVGTLAFLALSAFTADYARILLPIVTLAVPATWLIYRAHAADIAQGST